MFFYRCSDYRDHLDRTFGDAKGDAGAAMMLKVMVRRFTGTFCVFECFPYVCSERVLVKRTFFDIKASGQRR